MNDPILQQYHIAAANFQIAQAQAVAALNSGNIQSAEFHNRVAQKHLERANYYYSLLPISENQIEFEFGKRSKSKRYSKKK